MAALLTGPELLDYQAYHQVEPGGGWADDHRAALVAFTTHRAMGGKAGYSVFVPKWEPAEPFDYGKWAAAFKAIAEAHNARLQSKKG